MPMIRCNPYNTQPCVSLHHHFEASDNMNRKGAATMEFPPGSAPPLTEEEGGDNALLKPRTRKPSASSKKKKGQSPVATAATAADTATAETESSSEPRSFPWHVKQACWEKAAKIKGRDPDRWRRDALGNIVFRKLVGCNGCLCHDYDHILPYSKGGKSTLENCQVLQGAANRAKSNRTDVLSSELMQKSAYCRVTAMLRKDQRIVMANGNSNVKIRKGHSSKKQNADKRRTTSRQGSMIGENMLTTPVSNVATINPSSQILHTRSARDADSSGTISLSGTNQQSTDHGRGRDTCVRDSIPECATTITTERAARASISGPVISFPSSADICSDPFIYVAPKYVVNLPLIWSATMGYESTERLCLWQRAVIDGEHLSDVQKRMLLSQLIWINSE